ncbi:MAG: lysine--tRNA ligase [Synergistaceae bacterium]|nr:lysine--tRNA ligase [Synergistaceae bacterium]
MSDTTHDTHQNAAESEYNELETVKRGKLDDLKAQGKDPFVRVTYGVTHHSTDIRERFDELEHTEAAIAGRMMTKRVMGKASFCDVQDRGGRIQAYVSKNEIGDENYESFKHFDFGDFVGVKGEVFKTRTGEISIKASEIILLAKSLQIFPDKFHGLRDTELRYRQRYVDLTVNPEVLDAFLKRTAVIKSLRATLDKLGYVEVETPVLQSIPGGGEARPFMTHHNTLDMDMYLRIALELPLKRLIIGGLERVYEIGQCFRNEGISIKHYPEFMMLELYEAFTDYEGMMDLAETLIRNAASDALGRTEVTYGGVLIDLGKPFARMTMAEAVIKYAGVDFKTVKTDEEAKALAEKHNIEYGATDKKGNILSLFFEEYAEKHLIQPTFITDYPVEISPLTKRKPDDPDYVERFELFITAREFANAYSELNDPIEQRQRFEYQEFLRAAGDEEAHRIDEDFLLAMEYGMPPTGGMGMGIERLFMLLTDSNSIRDVIYFPTLRPN